MLQKVILTLALSLSIGYSAVNYPYPMRKLYGNSTINVKNSTADEDLKQRFKDYIRDFYVTGTCSGGGGGWTGTSGACARIKFTDPSDAGQANNTVSEGIGYAMLMAVYFSDKTTSYQTHFDNLWRYYKAHTNSNGLMNWKISGFGNVSGSGSATDAEYDVALALAMARYQFGDTQYENDAKTLIGKIWQYEMDSDGLHKPGDGWNDVKNPSYVAPAAFEIFKDLGTSSNWSTAITRNYTLLTANQNSTTGLPSGWANSSGNPTTCTNNCGASLGYDMDAVRAPWRWATANAWFGHSQAKTLLNKLATWVNGLQPGAVAGPISLSGSMGTDANAGYIGSLMNALSVNSTYQTKMNNFWSTMNTKNDASYFNQSLYLLTGLLATGNMPNLKACASSSGCGTTMPEEGGDGTYKQLDRLSVAGGESEEMRGYAATWEPWYAYTDEDADDGSGGKAQSTITNTKFTSLDENKNCAERQSYRVVQQDGTDWVVKISSYTLKQGTYLYEPFVALGLDARRNGKTGDGSYSLSGCTGFSYEYKGPAHKFKVQTTAITEGSGKDHFKIITQDSETAWKAVSVPNDELAQPTWVATADLVDFSPGKIYAFAWELVGSDGKSTAISKTTGNFAIKNFRCLGSTTLPAEKPASKCGSDGSSGSKASSSSVSGGGSSSSRPSSSSVSGGGSSSSRPSSSSVSGGGGSSSSRLSSSSRTSSSSTGGGGTSSAGEGNDDSSSSSEVSPIVLSQTVLSNGLNAMQNAVNLQATSKATVQIFDLKGNTVRSLGFAQGSYVVQMADLPKGLYLVKASSGSWKQTVTVPVK